MSNDIRRVATVGTFDGMHRGHQRVITTVKEEAARRGITPTVICFDRHPLETVAPQRAPRLIQSPSERTNALYRQGLDIHTLEFSPEMAALPAAQWLEKMHAEHNVDVLVVGYDNTFGSDGTDMSLADYTELGRRIGVDIVKAPYEPHVSSSGIRRLLQEGNLEEANRALGRPFEISGQVVAGKRLGGSLGFPTANVEPSYRALLPKQGVYAVDVTLPDGERRKGIANVGTQPTVAPDAPLRVEVHIPGFSANLYGQRLAVRFLERLRDEMRFPSVDDLREQIKKDIDSVMTREV